MSPGWGCCVFFFYSVYYRNWRQFPTTPPKNISQVVVVVNGGRFPILLQPSFGQIFLGKLPLPDLSIWRVVAVGIPLVPINRFRQGGKRVASVVWGFGALPWVPRVEHPHAVALI